jgi:Lipopolysaccharide-assembly
MFEQSIRLSLSRRQFLAGLVLGGASLAAGCGWDGHFTLLGYSTRDNYDHSIRSIYVPIFKNNVLQTTPYREMEMELTRAVQEQIRIKTPFKIVSDPNVADTELLGKITTFNKAILNRTQENEVREAELQIFVEIVWRDLRSGKILTNPSKPEGVVRPGELEPFDESNPPLPEDPEKPRPVLVRAPGRLLPEVGESSASAQTRVCNQLAVQIACMLEKPWKHKPRPVEPAPEFVDPPR